MAHRNGKERQMRLRLAQEAAQILLESGNRDYHAAKRKAAAHLGALDTRNMPSNTEIDAALQEYQRIFRADTQPGELRHLREAALEAMRFFVDFRPRLVGSVLRGTADAHSPVTLHLFAGAPEEFDLFLLHHGIPYETGEKRVRYSSEKYASIPMYRFLADETQMEVLVFPIDGPQQPPLSPIDGRPIQRADRAAVEKLLQNADEELSH